MPKKIRVLVVDDAAFMVKALTEMLDADPQIKVIGSAKNGQDGLEKIKLLKPDVITLDVDMPVMDGIRAVRHIMIEAQVPIVMLSSLFSHGEITFEALRLGVVDFLPKPSGAISKDIHEERANIIDRVKIAADVNIENIHRVSLCEIDSRERLTERYEYRALDNIIAIGTTLGGPNTVINMMSKLSPELPAAVVVVEEIAPKILPDFVQKFNQYTPWRVEIGSDGLVIQSGVCYICSYKSPLIVDVNENNEPCLKELLSSVEPLNDLFSSSANIFENHSIGVLLTGVGIDGAKGLAAIKKKSGVTIAQSTNTCVYPNLSDNAIGQGVVDFVYDVNEITQNLERHIQSLTNIDDISL